METPNQPTPRVPREPIREIDWLAIAPWLLILRAPRATLGWPLVLGGLGSLLLRRWTSVDSHGGPFSSSYDQFARFVADRVHWQYALGLRPDGTPHLAIEWWLWFGRLACWIAIGVFIADCVTPFLVSFSKENNRISLGRTIGRLRSAFYSYVLLTAAAAVPVLIVLGFVAALRNESAEGLASSMWGGVAILAGFPLALIWFLGVIACPLLVAAIVVDDCDPFDALSRTLAYTLQKPFTLAGCLILAWLVGVSGGAVVEWILRNMIVIMEAYGAPYSFLWENASADFSWRLIVTLARGFYPAYIFTAGVAVYLVMRHDIDGQPIDEMAGTSDQASSAA